MNSSLSTASEKAGMAPGTLVHVGEVINSGCHITVIDYDTEHFELRKNQSVEDILQYRHTDSLTWVVVEGLSEVGVIESIGAQFGIHQLVLEDILNTHQRPRFEEFDNQIGRAHV